MTVKRKKDELLLKKMNVSELKELCSRIREEIIDYTAENGGYMSANLSFVETAVALKKVFGEEDKIFYASEELSYADRLLNGRKLTDPFKESGLLQAAGAAIARDLDREDRHVIAVMDVNGSDQQKQIEALRVLSKLNRRLIIVCNDSYPADHRIGLYDKTVSRIRNTKAYNGLKDGVKGMIRPIRNGEEIIENIHNVKDRIKKSVINEGIFENLDISYIGPIDAHSIRDLCSAFRLASEKTYPVVIHCISVKGKGYRFAENDLSGRFDHISMFHKDTGICVHEETDDYRFPETIGALTIERMMQENEDLVAIATPNEKLGTIAARYPDRCLNISGSAFTCLSIGCGLAAEGKIPYLCFDAEELSSCLDLISKEISQLNRPFLIGMVLNEKQKNCSLPENVIVCEPKDSETLQNLLRNGMNWKQPLLLLYHEECLKYDGSADFQEMSVGKWEKSGKNELNRIAITSSGPDSKEIADIIRLNELPYDFYDMAFLQPLDEEMLKEIFTKHKKLYFYGKEMEKTILWHKYQKGYKTVPVFFDRIGVRGLFELLKEETDA